MTRDIDYNGNVTGTFHKKLQNKCCSNTGECINHLRSSYSVQHGRSQLVYHNNSLSWINRTSVIELKHSCHYDIPNPT